MSVVTRNILARTDMFRVVKTNEGRIVIDLSYKLKGRGAYIEKDKSIILLAEKKKALSRALKAPVDENIYKELIALL